MPPLVSIVVPVLADKGAVEHLLSQIRPDSRVELVLVDGGDQSTPGVFTAGRSDVLVIRARRGRAHQMNAGAAQATGNWLLFLHADSHLPADWLEVFEASTTGARGGWFQFALDDRAWQARVIERMVRWRVRVFRLPYGDQGLFVDRRAFASLGGYRDMPLMEDVEFVRRMVAGGRIVELPLALTTSARRWRRDGWFRRSAMNVMLVSLYFAGVSPARLARWYTRGTV